MKKKTKTRGTDFSELQSALIMQVFSFAIVTTLISNLFRKVYIFSETIDLIPCVALLAIGITAFLKCRTILMRYQAEWYLIYGILFMAIICILTRLTTPIPFEYVVLGIGFLLMKKRIQEL